MKLGKLESKVCRKPLGFVYMARHSHSELLVPMTFTAERTFPARPSMVTQANAWKHTQQDIVRTWHLPNVKK